jgi:acetylornithine/succinyldiaminopimelate/putrescine aminotransferase/predicted amino acid dehydrogenase
MITTAPTTHLRPRLQELLRSLRLDVTYHRGSGDLVYYRDDEGTDHEVLDLVGGFGSLLLGHSHPELIAQARQLLAAERPIHTQGSTRHYAQRLAAALSERAGGDFQVIFGNSGAEAVEVAMKHAMLETGGRTFIALEGGFHGKTLGAIQLTHNPYFRDAFGIEGLRVIHVEAGDHAGLERAFEEAGDEAAGFIWEPIQGEGGVRPVSAEFTRLAARLCREKGVPCIADEIQTGMGRTGHFLASQAIGVEPDYILLSKSLGGGIAKISACLIKKKHYLDHFDLRQSSTYADDDYSSAIALKTLSLIDEALLQKVREQGSRILEGLSEIASRFPTVIRQVRGAGMMFGIEFRPFEQSSSFLLRLLSSQDDLVKLLTGYLLHVHNIRVMPMLSDPFTLRLQPSAYIAEEHIQQFLGAFEDVCTRLERHDIAGLTDFCNPVGDQLELPGPTIPREDSNFFAYHHDTFVRREKKRPLARAAWLCHLIDADGLVSLEPAFAGMTEAKRESLLDSWSNQASPMVLSSVDVQSGTGQDLRLYTIVLPFTSRWIKDRLDRKETRLARAVVQQGVDLARSLDCQVAALGQYTSIITANGTRVNSGDMGLCSGNSYAVGLAIEAVQKAMHERAIHPAISTLAIVGAAGNIGRIIAEILSPLFRKTILIGNTSPGSITRIGNLAKQLDASGVTVASEIELAREADVVISAANSTIPVLEARHFRPGAVVCDLSVPASIHPGAVSRRDDVLFIKGGIVQLPGGEDLEITGFPLPKGQAYACMAEGMLLGLEGISDTSYTGGLKADRVSRIRRMATQHSFELARYCTSSPFESRTFHQAHHENTALTAVAN